VLQAVAAAAVPFDVVLLDFRLPDSSDLALLSRLRRLAPATRIVLMTAYGTPEIVQAAQRRGVPVLLDAAQSLSHLPLDVKTLGVDFIAESADLPVEFWLDEVRFIPLEPNGAAL